jgi:hypothetical protein
MDGHVRKCLERAAEILRLAEAESDPELKAYLVNLAASWTKAAGDIIAEPEGAEITARVASVNSDRP